MIFVMSTRPSLNRRPMMARSWILTVHTTSPLFTGSMWWIWMPTLPAGCLPAKVCSSAPLEHGHLPLGLGTHREVHFARREAAHHLDAGLEILLLVAEHEVVIRGQRRGVEGGNENGLRRVVRVGDDAIGAAARSSAKGPNGAAVRQSPRGTLSGGRAWRTPRSSAWHPALRLRRAPCASPRG